MKIEICKICGSDRLQEKMWVEIISGETFGTCGDDSDLRWCPKCESEVDTEFKEIIQVRCKGDLMKAVYTEQELRSIDSALPIAYWDGKNKHIQVDTATHVVNYNQPNSYGVLEDMMLVAKQRGLNVEWIE